MTGSFVFTGKLPFCYTLSDSWNFFIEISKFRTIFQTLHLILVILFFTPAAKDATIELCKQV